MALIKCPDCGREVSSRAPVCPQCGGPIAAGSVVDPKTVHGRGEGVFLKSMNCGCIAVLLLIACVILAGVIGGFMADNDDREETGTGPHIVTAGGTVWCESYLGLAEILDDVRAIGSDSALTARGCGLLIGGDTVMVEERLTSAPYIRFNGDRWTMASAVEPIRP